MPFDDEKFAPRHHVLNYKVFPIASPFGEQKEMSAGALTGRQKLDNIKTADPEIVVEKKKEAADHGNDLSYFLHMGIEAGEQQR